MQKLKLNLFKLNTGLVFMAAVVVLLTGCSRDSGKKEVSAVINARITVADSLDSSGDYSGIKLQILDFSAGDEQPDTLFVSETDSTGQISGKVVFRDAGLYPAFISRNEVNFLTAEIILAGGDTLNISGELPGLSENLKVESREEKAAGSYTRVENGFSRTLAFIRAGAIEDSLIGDEITKWSDLFWQVYTGYPGTIAASLGAQRSIQLLENFDDDLLLQRLDESLEDNEMMINFAGNFGKTYMAEHRGLEAAVQYLDSLRQLAKSNTVRQNLDKEIVKIYYDSAETAQARRRLNGIQKDKAFKKDEALQNWSTRMEYDLDYLSAGKEVPAFSFLTLEGDSVSSESLKGSVYVLEIAPVTGEVYKDQFDRSAILKQIYAGYALEFFTIPLEDSRITVEAFFEDRENPWPAAAPGSFPKEEILEKFNVSATPVRLLIDKEGRIVRKYVAYEFDDVISGLNSVFSNTEQDEEDA